MDGDLDGKASPGAAGEGDSSEQALAQGDQDAQADGAKEVAGDGADDGVADYQAALRAKDAEIETLQARVVEAAKTSEATETLNKEIAALKKQMADERVEFTLRSAGARWSRPRRRCWRSTTATWQRSWLPSPGLFEGAEVGTSQRTSQDSVGGATGLEPAGVAGSSDDQYMKRWEMIADLADESKEG